MVDPLVATEYEITEYPTVAFESMESERRHKMVLTTRALEADFVTGLLIVTGQEQKQVYALEGHGERLMRNVEEDKHLGLALGGILRENYAFSTVNLSSTEGKETLVPAVDSEESEENPEGAQKKPVSMLVIAAPEKEPAGRGVRDPGRIPEGWRQDAVPGRAPILRPRFATSWPDGA